MSYVMEKDFTFKVDYNKKAAFLSEAHCTSSTVIIPKKVNNCPVVSIMQEAFKDNLDIQIVTIPASVEYIGAKAFMNCVNLKTVIVENEKDYDDNVTLNLYCAVFANCTSLTDVDLRYPTQIMDWCAFENCVNLENISTDCIRGDIPSRTFDGCVKLRKFTSAGIECIEEKAFRNVILSHFNEYGEIQKYSKDFMQALKFAKISCPKTSKFTDLAYAGYDISCY